MTLLAARCQLLLVCCGVLAVIPSMSTHQHQPCAVLQQLEHGCVSAPAVSRVLSCNTTMIIQSSISSVPSVTSVLHSSRPFISLAPFHSEVISCEEFNGGKLQKAWLGGNK